MSLDRRSPRILVTVADASAGSDPENARAKNDRYADAVARHGATPLVLDATGDAATQREAFATMDGLLLTGGADVDPARYGRPVAGATDLDPERDALEAAAWAAAAERDLPVLGICRGLQAINVFSGGTLLQHVDGHAGVGWGRGPAQTHPLRIAAGSRLARILFPTRAPAPLEVNTYHHQGVRAEDLAPGLVATAWAKSAAGELVEALEAPSGRFVLGVQCHPERTESTPEVFERLFAFFVDACRGPRA